MRSTVKRTIPANIRQLVLDRDRYACQECGATKESGAVLHLHHVIPEKIGGTEEPNNLVTLCDIHHSVRHIEFQAYYPSSSSVLAKMAAITVQFLQKIRLGSNGDYDRQLKALLTFLTGQDTFRTGQEGVIRSLAGGEDVLFVTPTGSGKSLCYQIAGLQNEKPSLVITPLKALMRDQAMFLANKKIPTTYIDSDVGSNDKANRIKMIRAGLFRFVFLTPERFFWPSLKTDNPLLINYGLLTIDEAHCVDKWGRHFRPAYSQLGTLRTNLKFPQTLALTASASANVQDRILNSLGIPHAKRIVTGFYRPEIDLSVRKVGESPYGLPRSKEGIFQIKLGWLKQELIGENKKEDDLGQRLTVFKRRKGRPRVGKVIVFVSTVAQGKNVLESLERIGLEAAFYHSRLHKDERIRIQNRFTGQTQPRLDILIATSAFGMGLNIPNIRQIVHWSLPASMEDYYQQIGRAGRDGKKSKAVLFYADGDEGLVRYMNQKSRESKRDLTRQEEQALASIEEDELQVMIGYLASSSKWKYILDYFGEQRGDIKQAKRHHTSTHPTKLKRRALIRKQVAARRLTTAEKVTIVILALFIIAMLILALSLAQKM